MDLPPLFHPKLFEQPKMKNTPPVVPSYTPPTATTFAQIYSPDDGHRMGLQGMIDDMLKQCDFQKTLSSTSPKKIPIHSPLRSPWPRIIPTNPKPF